MNSRQVGVLMDRIDSQELLDETVRRGAVILDNSNASRADVAELLVTDALPLVFLAIVPADFLPALRHLGREHERRRLDPEKLPILSLLRPRNDKPATHARLQYFPRVWAGEQWTAQPESFVAFCASYYRWIKRWAGPAENRVYVAPHARSARTH